MQDLMKLVEQEKVSISKSLRITEILSVLLVTLVLAEVLFIRTVVRNKMAPDSVALMLTEAAYNQIPVINDKLVSGSYQNAPLVANQLVEYSLQILRGVGPVAKKNTLCLMDKVMVDVHTQVAPAFQKLIVDAYDGIYANKDQLKDKAFVQKAVNGLMVQWEIELRSKIDAGLKDALVNMNGEVKTLLSTPEKKMTKKQLAQKKMLICSKVLVDRISVQ